MSRTPRDRLEDVLTSLAAIRAHLDRGGLDDSLVFDAVRIRLVEIGEAVKDLQSGLVEREPDIPWRQIAGMRDRLAHHYFETSRRILQATVDHDLPELEQAIHRLLDALTADRDRDLQIGREEEIPRDSDN